MMLSMPFKCAVGTLGWGRERVACKIKKNRSQISTFGRVERNSDIPDSV